MYRLRSKGTAIIRCAVRAALLAALAAPAAWPAAAQGALVQACVRFGQAQYVKLDPSITRVIVGEHPPPVLERFEARAGAQAIAGVLTLKGQLTYRGRPTFETQFVCLLDAADRPVMFYALPAMVGRPSPTPLARGGTAQPDTAGQPKVALGPPASSGGPSRATVAAASSSLSGTNVRMRGLVRDLGDRLQFSPCDGVPLPLEDRTQGQELTRTLRDLTVGRDGRPVFVEILGGRDGRPGGDIAALELRRAAVETVGCRERFDQREWVAVGSEPAWRLEITGRDMVMIQPGVGAGARIVHGGLRRDAGRLLYAGSQPHEIRIMIEERRCIDGSSGSLFSYYVEVRSEGKSLSGCAAHNPAMPPP